MGTQTPEPAWRSVSKAEDIEVRDYDPMIVAEVTVEGERYTAIKAGFRILAGYIFGGNTAQAKISMTAPVTQEAAEENSQKIPMTAPVIQEASENQNEWKVQFVMPAEFTRASLPKPKDDQIRFLEIPSYRAAVIRFSGFNTDDNLSRHLQKLTAWLEKNNIHPRGLPVYAFYNPPWTLPFLRRNEIIIKIQKDRTLPFPSDSSGRTKDGPQ